MYKSLKSRPCITAGGSKPAADKMAEALETVAIAADTQVSLDGEGRIIGFADGGAYEDIGGLQLLAVMETKATNIPGVKQTLCIMKAVANLLAFDMFVHCLSVPHRWSLPQNSS